MHNPEEGLAAGIDELVPRAVHLLCDAVAAFPESIDVALPGAGSHAPWILHSHCYLIRVGGRAVLVDTGIGPRGGPAGTWLTVGGRLPDLLAELAVDVAEIDAVVLTHLHLDHVGWNLRPGEAAPLFPNASYVVQSRELVHVRAAAAGIVGSTYETLVAPVERSGQLVVVDGEHAIADGVDLIPSPGHTPGHQSVRVGIGNAEILLAGDAFVHPSQVEDPDVAYVYEWDAPQAAQTRRAFLDRGRRTGALLAPAHFPEPLPLYAFRAAAPSDADDVTALVRASYEHYVARIGVTPRPMTDDYSLVIGRDAVTVVHTGGTVVGVLVLAAREGQFLIENVAVHPSHQGRGLGRALLDRAEAEARRQGYDAIHLYTHEKMSENLAIYSRRGFVEIDRRTVGPFARVFMRKNLGRTP